MSAMNLRRMMVALVLVGVLAAFVQADKSDVQAKLSKEVNIQLKDVTIVEALEEIGKKAELEIVLSDEAVWKLPQGGATRLRVMLQGPLAESLTEMLNAFFMRYAVGQEQITIYPRPELEHILGRPTAKQLELLTKIYNATITVSRQVSSKAIMSKFLGQEVLVLPVEYYTELDKFLRELTLGVPEGDKAPVFTIAHMLDSRGGAWYLSGMDFPNQIPEIRMTSSMRFRQAKLDQIVDISMEDNAPEIIQRLTNWTGMTLRWDKRDPDWPGGTISVDMQNIKLGQALRNVISMVDGEYSIDVGDNRIQVVGPKRRPTTARKGVRPPTRRPSDSGKIVRAGGDYVGKISIPMDEGKYFIEFMLRESDLTEELRKLRDEKMEQILGRPPRPRPAATPVKPATTRTKRSAGLSE
ncbi:MAG: hypothetical protein ACYSX1_00305 [Planctomycetota bacterium]|jgi:hypothetical protein